MIDKNILSKIKNHKFHKTQYGYVATKIDNKIIFLHHLILPIKDGLEVDHINNNKLDNRRCNLRLVTRSQNQMNIKTSKGVCWDKSSKSWMARITVNYKRIYLGCFKDEKQALKARRNAEKIYFREYAFQK